MVQTQMLAHANLNPRRIQSIYVVRVGKFRSKSAGIKAVFLRFSKQTHGYPTSQGSKQRVADTDIRQSVHREINLLRLPVELRNGTCAVVFRRVHVRHKVDCWIDRKSGILARQWAGDVGIVSVKRRVRPVVVITRLETVYDCRVVAKVPRTIDVVLKRDVRPDVRITEIGAGEDDLVLTGEYHGLRVKNAVTEFVPHGDARCLELIKEDLVVRKLLISPWFDRESDRDTRLIPADNGIGKFRKREEIKLHVYADVFGADSFQ